jgi:copper chaperone NosL
MRRRRSLAFVVPLAFVWATGACATSARPVAVDPHADACAYCRMLVSDPRFASQIVAPGEDPKFFDDLSCLRAYLDRAPLPAGAAIFVADHRTREWIAADSAVYAKSASTDAPMGSRLVAHSSTDSRALDADVASAVAVSRKEAIGR